MIDPEFPILGTESLAVEFANTLYGGGDARVDYLRTTDLIDQWFAAVSLGEGLAASSGVSGREAQQVRDLRDCVHRLLSAAIDGCHPDRGDVDELNGFAAAASTSLVLSWAHEGVRTARRLDSVAGSPAILGRVATCAIELLAGPAAGELRRCRGPGCGMLFVKHHARRRFCHPSCGQRDRQARYYRRHVATPVSR